MKRPKNTSHLQKFQKSFKEKVLEVVKNIRRGEVMTYGQVASASGAVGAARAVGTIMSQNQDKNIPCHRVVAASGRIGGYNGLRTSKSGAEAKMKLLKKEGVEFTKSGRIIMLD